MATIGRKAEPPLAAMQIIDIPDIKTGEGLYRNVRLTVEEIYEGEDFPSLAVSEVGILMKEFDARVTISAASAEVAGKGKELATDENPKTAFATQAGAEKDPVCVVAKQTGHYMGNVTVAPSSAPLVGQPKPFKG